LFVLNLFVLFVVTAETLLVFEVFDGLHVLADHGLHPFYFFFLLCTLLLEVDVVEVSQLVFQLLNDEFLFFNFHQCVFVLIFESIVVGIVGLEIVLEVYVKVGVVCHVLEVAEVDVVAQVHLAEKTLVARVARQGRVPVPLDGHVLQLRLQGLFLLTRRIQLDRQLLHLVREFVVFFAQLSDFGVLVLNLQHFNLVHAAVFYCFVFNLDFVLQVFYLGFLLVYFELVFFDDLFKFFRLFQVHVHHFYFLFQVFNLGFELLLGGFVGLLFIVAFVLQVLELGFEIVEFTFIVGFVAFLVDHEHVELQLEILVLVVGFIGCSLVCLQFGEYDLFLVLHFGDGLFEVVYGVFVMDHVD